MHDFLCILTPPGVDMTELKGIVSGGNHGLEGGRRNGIQGEPEIVRIIGGEKILEAGGGGGGGGGHYLPLSSGFKLILYFRQNETKYESANLSFCKRYFINLCDCISRVHLQ